MKLFPYLKLFLDTRSRSVLSSRHARPANPRRPKQRPRSPPGSGSRGRAGPHPPGAFPERDPPADRLRQGARRDAAPARGIAERPHRRVCFGSNDITAILVRIARGLHRAAALEAWLITWVPRSEAASARSEPSARAPAPRQPRAAQPAAQRAEADDAGPAQPPTLEDIVARDRRRPIGAVIAEICCDLGIVPNHGCGARCRPPSSKAAAASSRCSGTPLAGSSRWGSSIRPSSQRALNGRQYLGRRCRRPRVPARPERTALTIEATRTGPAMAGPAIRFPRRRGGCGEGYSPSPCGRGLGEGSIGGPHQPLPQPPPTRGGGSSTLCLCPGAYSDADGAAARVP